MVKRLLLLAVVGVVALLLCVPRTAIADPAVNTVTITATVDTFAEWSTSTTTFAKADEWAPTADGHVDPALTNKINHVGEFLTLTRTLTLYCNGNPSIVVAATDANAGTVTNATGDTLTTSYRLTSAAVTNSDGDYISAAAFLAKTYTVEHTTGGDDGAYEISLMVKLSTDLDRAHDAGDYTCQLTLTVGF